jgi:hypothetical protein
LRAERADQIWSYAIVEAETYDGRRFKVMAVIDEFSHECLTIRVLRDATASALVLSDLYGRRGRPEQVRSDDGALAGKSFLPSFVARLRSGLISSEAFASPRDAQFAFDGWMREYNAGLRVTAARSPVPPAPRRVTPAEPPASPDYTPSPTPARPMPRYAGDGPMPRFGDEEPMRRFGGEGPRRRFGGEGPRRFGGEGPRRFAGDGPMRRFGGGRWMPPYGPYRWGRYPF